MKKVIYLVVREDIKSSLIKSQVIDLLKENVDMQIIFFWFYGIEKFFYKKYLKERKFFIKKFPFKYFFSPFFSYRFPVPFWQIPFIFLPHALFLSFYVYFKKIDIIHARSYNAGLIAFFVKKFIGISFIFDPRSPYPEEQTDIIFWKEKSINYKIWKFIETKLINNADKVILVSWELKNLYKNIDIYREYCYLPNNYPLSFEEKKERVRPNYKLGNIDIVYIGSIGLKWNNYKTYINFIKKLRCKTDMPFSFTMITPEKFHKEIKKYLLEEKVDIILTSCIQEEVPEILSKYTAGIYLMEREDPRLGVKTVEYLFCGLPVIVSNNIVGASKIINENKLGFIVASEDLEKKDLMNFLNEISNNRKLWRDKCHDFAVKNFSPITSREILSKLYINS